MLSISHDLTHAVMARLPDADRQRRNRRLRAKLGRPAVAAVVALLCGLVGASALPAYGATSARVAVKAVSWILVAQSLATNLSAQLLGDLHLEWLPIATAVLVLATVGYGADRRMRMRRAQGVAPEGRKLLVALLTLVVLAAAVAPAIALSRGTVHLGPRWVGPDETLRQTLLVVAGDVVVVGRTTQPLFVLWGDAHVVNRADDDVVAIGGNVLLAEGSVAARDVVAIGGRVLREDNTTVLGNVAGQELRWTRTALRADGDVGSVLVVRLRLALLGAAAGMLLAISAVTLVPWLVVLTASTGRGEPMHSGLIGLAGLACAPLLIVPLALSLVGAPLAAILGVGLVICWWIGAASSGFLVGRWLLRLVGRDGSLTRATLLGGALLGALLGVPVVGGLFGVLFGAAGAGALLLALIEGEFGSARAPETTFGMVYE